MPKALLTTMTKDKEKQYLQHEHNITVAVNDADFHREIKPGAIMGFFQDIAVDHAEMLGFGSAEMRARNLVWIMARMSFLVSRLPKIGDKLTVRTFPEKPGAFDVNRGYYIFDKTGSEVISGSSKWCVLDINTNKLQRCAPVFEKFDDSEFIPYPPFEDANPKIKAAQNTGQTGETPLIFQVQVTDLDQNFHMNNARYGDVILNACGVEMLQNNRLARLDVNFISQLFVGDKYEVYKVQKGDTIFIEAKKPGSDTAVFRANAEWRKREM